jgi:hypothetical protein
VSTSKYRARSGARKVIALSISYERDTLLQRGMKIEHLRELLLGLAGPMVRGGANLAYAGHWRESDDNFTYDLLQLISAERDEQNLAGATSGIPVGWLYNHLAWPLYALVTPQIEAQWVNCCRIIRITQALAGIPAAARAPDPLTVPGADAVALNSAIVLSAMRKLATVGMTLEIEGMPSDQYPKVPGLNARVLLGGKTRAYSGLLPGLFEEALLAFEHAVPLFILGGFGGSACVLAELLLAPKGQRPPELTLAWHEHQTPQVTQLNVLASRNPQALPEGIRTTQAALDALYERIDAARGSLATHLRTGLSEDETRELMTTIDIRRAVYLSLKGIMPDALA